MTSTSYLFIFGRTPDLAFLELARFFPDAVRVTNDVARVHTENPVEKFQTILGGTVKIAREIGTISDLSAESFLPMLPNQTNLHIGISGYGAVIPTAVLSTMKKLLETQGIRLRYATAKHGSTISSVTVDKTGLTELVVVKDQSGFCVGQTISIQDYESWNKRDYGRPYADAKSGMLPPKVARMLVNIAGTPGTLLDPFCGMGTVLAEASLSGWNVIGSDISSETIRKTKANLDWLGATSGMHVCDATHVSEVIPVESINAIVTEPFMGSTNIAFQQNPDSTKIKNIIKGLEKLYIGCLREWKKILTENGKVIIALPEYSIGGRTYFVKKVVDMCENLGYTTHVGPIEYGRPQAIVKRKFYIFQKVWHT